MELVMVEEVVEAMQVSKIQGNSQVSGESASLIIP